MIVEIRVFLVPAEASVGISFRRIGRIAGDVIEIAIDQPTQIFHARLLGLHVLEDAKSGYEAAENHCANFP